VRGLAARPARLRGMRRRQPSQAACMHRQAPARPELCAAPSPRSWSPASGEVVYSGSNSVDDLAVAAAWRCRLGVTGSCAEATAQLDRAMADGSLYWTPVSLLDGRAAAGGGQQGWLAAAEQLHTLCG
jgi:hypothetical protein